MKINFELGQDYINYSAEYPANSVSGATLIVWLPRKFIS